MDRSALVSAGAWTDPTGTVVSQCVVGGPDVTGRGLTAVMSASRHVRPSASPTQSNDRTGHVTHAAITTVDSNVSTDAGRRVAAEIHRYPQLIFNDGSFRLSDHKQRSVLKLTVPHTVLLVNCNCFIHTVVKVLSQHSVVLLLFVLVAERFSAIHILPLRYHILTLFMTYKNVGLTFFYRL